jgi:Methyltransferase FkbM domain
VKEKEIVSVVRLDDFIESNELDFPDYLKVDIDGSEFAFIKGAQNTLKSKKLKKIIFELEIRDQHFNDIISNLLDNGFKEEARFVVPNEPFLYNIVFTQVL